MFLSAYLNGKMIQQGSVEQLARRMKRLYLPFAAWGILYFFGRVVISRKFDIADLFLQLAIGVPLCPPLYFMFLLAVNTLLLFLVARCGRCSMALLAAFLVGCLVLQYTGLNARIFAGLPFQPRHALGRFAELLPAAICGYFLFLSDRKWLVALGSIFLLPFVAAASCHMLCPGFGYQGVSVLCVAVCLSSAAILLGETVLCRLPKGAVLLTGWIAGLTPGIYYVHMLVGIGIGFVAGRHRSILEGVAVFILSAGLVFAMRRTRKLAWMVA